MSTLPAADVSRVILLGLGIAAFTTPLKATGNMADAANAIIDATDVLRINRDLALTIVILLRLNCCWFWLG